MLSRKFPAVKTMLRQSTTICWRHRLPCRALWSTNPLERLNKEIKRRIDVVGVFRGPAALLRLADEWQASHRRYLSEGYIALL